MILYLVRHAEPQIAEYSGFPGPQLGTIGKKQAIAIANFLKNRPIQQIIASDYTRVLETIEPYQILAQKPLYNLPELRERENEIETHEELVTRVQTWFRLFLTNNRYNTVIVSHCGPINMILWELDYDQTILNYPFECKYLCLTPKAGIWELQIDNQILISGRLIMECC
ncbi:MAG: histidine phosphatase family protein [Chitinophagales bacterium]|nr:histidine phosphatase family protein [Chitinophagales bacterium]